MRGYESCQELCGDARLNRRPRGRFSGRCSSPLVWPRRCCSCHPLPDRFRPTSSPRRRRRTSRKPSPWCSESARARSRRTHAFVLTAAAHRSSARQVKSETSAAPRHCSAPPSRRTGARTWRSNVSMSAISSRAISTIGTVSPTITIWCAASFSNASSSIPSRSTS